MSALRNFQLVGAGDSVPAEPLDDLLAQFAQSLKSDKTREIYCRRVRQFLTAAGRSVQELTGADLSRWLLTIELPHARSQCASAVKRFGIFLHDGGYRPDCYGAGRLCAPPPKRPRDPNGLFSIEDMARMFAAAATLRTRHAEMLIRLYYHTGCRASELTELAWAAVKEDCSGATVIGKGSKPRDIEFPPELAAWIASLPRTTERVFPVRGKDNKQRSATMLRLVKRAGQLAGIDKKLTTHRLRNAAITRMLRKKPPHVVALYVGHENLNTTMGYVLPEEGENMAATVDWIEKAEL